MASRAARRSLAVVALVALGLVALLLAPATDEDRPAAATSTAASPTSAHAAPPTLPGPTPIPDAVPAASVDDVAPLRTDEARPSSAPTEPDLPLRGTVRTSHGELAWARVNVDVAGVTTTVQVDASGRFEVLLGLPKGVELFLSGVGEDREGNRLDSFWAHQRWTSGTSDYEEHLGLMPVSRLRGRLQVLPAFSPRPTEVTVAGKFPAASIMSVATIRTVPVSDDGSWDAGEVPALHELVVAAPGIHEQRVTLAPGEERVLEQDLRDRTLELGVRVEGIPAGGVVTVTARFDGAAVQAPITDGRALLPNLRQGPVALETVVSFPRGGRWWVGREVTVLAGSPPVVIALPPAGTVDGRFASQGARRPVPARSADLPEVEARVQADDEGRFVLELPAGRWTIGPAWAQTIVEVVPGRSVEVVLGEP